MPNTKKKQPVKPKFANQEFVGKPITDKPPDTFPLIPIGKDDCMHSKRKWIVSKQGYNCYDCGYFVPKKVVAEAGPSIEEPHVAVQDEPKQLKTPKFDEKYQIIELPRTCFGINEEKFVKDDSFHGEADKRRLILFAGYLKNGYRIHTFIQNQGNSFVFLLEKE